MESVFLYNISGIIKKETDLFLQSNRHFSLYQEPEWAAITNPKKKCCFYILKENDGIIAFAVISEQLYGASLTFGPLVKEDNILQFAITEIVQYYKKKLFGIIEIQLPEADLIVSTDLIKKTESKHHILNHCRGGWATKKICLKTDINSLFNSFSENHKRSINKALKEGLEVRNISGNNDINSFANLYINLYQKRGILMPFSNPANVFRQIQNYIIKSGKGLMLGVYKDQQLLAGIILGFHNKTLFYHYGASDRNTKIPLTHLAFFEAMKTGKNMKFEFLDLGGYDLPAGYNNQTFLINRFKDGFGGTVVKYPPLLIFRLNPLVFFFRNIIRSTYLFIKKNLP